MLLENKVVLITGASRGIGRATAIEAARQGADVAINSFRDAEAAAEVVVEIERLGRRAIAVDGDVALPESEQLEEADRRRGVGFDQLMLLEGEAPANGDVAYRVFNADGGEVEHWDGFRESPIPSPMGFPLDPQSPHVRSAGLDSRIWEERASGVEADAPVGPARGREARELIVSETGGNLRTIRDVLDALERRAAEKGVKKGGEAPELEGRICLCNGLMAAIGLGQQRPDGYEEAPLLTLGASLGDIGAAIQRHAESHGYSIVREFCGHGIGRK
mgnify:CR=1 FL=1